MAMVGVADDATLALGVAAGDSRALAAVYDRYAGRLLAFCQAQLDDRAEAQECLRDVFVLAATGLADLRRPAMLRGWLFATARHVCRQRLESRAASAAPAIAIAGAAAADDSVPIDLFATTVDEVEIDAEAGSATGSGPLTSAAYADHLVLELAERQYLPPADVAVALGVATTAVGPIISRARRANRRSGGVLLGPGTAFSAEMVAARPAILAAASSTTPAGGRTLVAGFGGWVGGWPPSDPAFATTATAGAGARRWGAPLAVLVVLLVALGAIVGLLNTAGGGRPSAASSLSVADDPTGPASSKAAPGAGASLAATGDTPPAPGPGGAGGAVAVAPPTPSQPPSSSAPPTLSQPPPPSGTWTLVISTDQHAVVITAGHAQVGCAAQSACSYLIAGNAIVTVADTSGGRGKLASPDRFSAPPSCSAARGSCTFAVTSNLVIKLTSASVATIGPRAG